MSPALDPTIPQTPDPHRYIGVSSPVFFNGTGFMFWDTRNPLQLLAVFEPEPPETEGRIVDLSEQLGEMVALGWPNIGAETGLFEEGPVVEVASVKLLGLSPEDRFYLVNGRERQAARLNVEFITRAVAAGVHRMLHAALTEEADEPDLGSPGDDIALH